MKNLCKRKYLMILALAAVTLAGCSDDDDKNNKVPVGTFACDIAGNSFAASIDSWAFRYQADQYFTVTEFSGSGPYLGDTVTVKFFMEGDGDECPCVIHFGGFEESMFDDATVNSLRGESHYTTAKTHAHGMLYIEYSSGNITGSFNFVAYNSGGTDSLIVKNGVYNLKLVDTTFGQ